MHDPKRCPWEFRAVKLSSNAQPKGGTQRWSSDIQAIHSSGVPISSAYQILRIHFLSVQSYQIKKLQAYKDFCDTQATSEVCEDLRSSSWWTTATSEVWQWPCFDLKLCAFLKAAEARFALEKHHSGVWQSSGKQEAVFSGTLRKLVNIVKLRNLGPSWAVSVGLSPRKLWPLSTPWLAAGKLPSWLKGGGVWRARAQGVEPSWGRGLVRLEGETGNWGAETSVETKKAGRQVSCRVELWGGVGRGLRGGLGAYILVFRIHTSCRYLSGSVYMRKVYFYIPQTAYMLKNNNNKKKPSVWKKPGVIPRGWEVRIARGRLAKPRCGASWRLWSWRQASLAHLALSLCAASEGRFHNAFCIEVSFCLVAQLVKNPPAVQVSQVWSLGWEDNLEKEMATHSSVLAWRIPWAEKPGGLQSVGSQESDMTLRLNRHLVLPKRYTENVLKKVVT